MDSTQLATVVTKVTPSSQITLAPTTVSLPAHPAICRQAIRTSLKASTIDAVFAGVFTITTTGILLSNFLVELDASPLAFGILSAIPMLVNLIQPLGAYENIPRFMAKS